MSEGLIFRTFAEGDRAALIALWERCGLLHPTNDPSADIDLVLARAHARLLVGEDAGAIIASIMMGEDGHRAWVYYVAVAPEKRGAGIGRLLMGEAETWARARGLPKLNLMVRTHNLAAADFYTGIDYAPSASQTFQKVLTPVDKTGR